MKNIDEIPFKFCKYFVESCIVKIPGEDPYKLNVSEQFLSMIFECNYDRFYYPFFEIMINVPNSIYRKMKEKSTNLHVQIMIKYALFERDEIADEVKDVKKYDFINGEFYIFMEDDGTEVTDVLQKEVEKNVNYEERKGTNVSNDTTARLLLYKEDPLTKPKQTMHRVFRNCNLTDAITYLLNKIEVKKVLMTKTANTRKYNELKLQPVRIIESLERLCNDYGMHEHGSVIFFDYRLLYILDKGTRCTAWEPGEKKLNYVICKPMVKSDKSISGVYIDDEENVNYITMRVTQSTARSIQAEQIFGSKIKVVDNRTGMVNYYEINRNEIKRVEKMNDLDITRTIVINTGNGSTIDALLTRIKEQSMTWVVNLDNTLVSLLKPNKDYNFVFTDTAQTKYNGFYRIANFISIFTKNDGQWFSAQTLATFYGAASKSNTTGGKPNVDTSSYTGDDEENPIGNDSWF